VRQIYDCAMLVKRKRLSKVRVWVSGSVIHEVRGENDPRNETANSGCQ